MELSGESSIQLFFLQVDALKLMVESGLEQHVDDESVVPLLTVAHHCNAAHLKVGLWYDSLYV